MIYQLAQGDITKKVYVENKLDIMDFYEWFMLKKYENYCEAEGMKRKQGKGKAVNNFKGFNG